MEDSALRLLGIAFKAGRLAVGEEPVAASARAKQARVILLAADAADNSVRRAAHFAQAWGAPMAITPWTKAQLGRAVGRSSCAMLAVEDAGLAAGLAGKLAAADPAQHGALAQLLAHRADKALQRQREQRRHEQKLKRGKAPWAPPPRAGEAPPRPGGTGKKRKRRPAHGKQT